MRMILKSIFIISLILLSGCISLQEGQAIVNENRVIGIDASVPVPYSGGYSIANVRFGWVETKTVIVNDVKVISESSHKEINIIKGQGSIDRTLTVEPIKEK